MQFSYHQLIVLTAYANAHIAGLKPPPFSKTLAMKHIAGMKFKGAAENPEDWFASLKGASGARLHNRNQDWRIEILYPNEHSHFWSEGDGEDGFVLYTRKKGPARPPHGESVGQLTSRLMTTLDDIHAFSKRNDCGNFTRIFAQAKACLALDATQPKDWKSEFSPGGVLAPEAERLLAACTTAWVFGGMGSWNDLGFDGAEQENYNGLSGLLYSDVNEGIVVAVSR
jgi:hypothetical protein